VAGRRMSAFAVILAVAAAVLVGSVGVGHAADRTLPVKATFYYPWFPETWHTNDHYHPTLGNYESGNMTVLASHVAMMKYAGMDAAISSWWGRGTPTDNRLPGMLDVAAAQGFALTAYHEPEGSSNPTVATLQADLGRLGTLAAHAGWLRVGGKPVLFVYNANDTTCEVVDRWKQAAGTNWYLNMKVFTGYANCPNQPDSWHQYGPATAYSTHGTHHANVSPGFWLHTEATPRLARDLDRFKADISRMADASVSWKLVTSFNEWGEGTSVEPATEWLSPSGYGTFLDAMRAVFVNGQRFGTTPPPPPPPPAAVTVAAAGDIACEPSSPRGASTCAHDRTANTVGTVNPDAVLTLGDNQYEDGAEAKFKDSRAYDGTWGRVKDKTYPAPGNHEWLTPNAAGYRAYFGPGTGTPTAVNVNRMYYSFDLGGWHFISLESDCSKVGGCAAGNPQTVWLDNDLAANDGEPTLVYYHHPRWSSGQHGNSSQMVHFWDLFVADKDVQVVLSGHDHAYERFAPMGSTGPAAGPRQFTNGAGGKNHTCLGTRKSGSEVFDCTTFGVLKLTLKSDGGYDWQFVAATGTGSFTDSGTQTRRT
jgi:hypothetical protein